MKTLSLLILILLGSLHPARAERPFVLYAEFIEDTTVDLTDGSQWAMDKGDCFPIYMFKEQQKKVVLQLGAATFMTETSRMRILKESDAPRALQSYRKNLENYLKSKADRWKKEAAAPAKTTTP